MGRLQANSERQGTIGKRPKPVDAATYVDGANNENPCWSSDTRRHHMVRVRGENSARICWRCLDHWRIGVPVRHVPHCEWNDLMNASDWASPINRIEKNGIFSFCWSRNTRSCHMVRARRTCRGRLCVSRRDARAVKCLHPESIMPRRRKPRAPVASTHST
jgi:hypothetical protein